MSNARKLAANLPTEGSLSERNLVINGNMTIAQRSTSVSSQTGSGYKTVDRIYTNASGATYNQSQQTVTVGGETGLPLQFTKYLRHNVTTGNDWSQIYQKIEDVALVPEGTVTLSFYAKGTTPASGLTVYCFQNFGSGGSGEVGIPVSQTSTLTSTWQRFTVPITIPSITGKTIGTGSHFYFGIGQGGSTSTNAWTLDITGLMLEAGPQSTPFEHESAGVTLRKCQRYFARMYYGSTAANAGFSNSYGTYMPTPAIMRVTPTASVNTVFTQYPGGSQITPTISVSGGPGSSSGEQTFIRPLHAGNNGSNYIEGAINVDAEL